MIDAFLLPQYATYNPMNRQVRDPYPENFREWYVRRTDGHLAVSRLHNCVSFTFILSTN